MEVTEMVSAVSVPVVSSFWCPLSLLEVLFTALQHKQRKANTTVCREERNKAAIIASLMQEREEQIQLSSHTVIITASLRKEERRVIFCRQSTDFFSLSVTHEPVPHWAA